MSVSPSPTNLTDPTSAVDHSSHDRWCVVGAGTSGLAVVKNFLQQGLSVDCYEREDDLGGNWNFGKPNSSVYRSTHLISSKSQTEYIDFPMPDDWPEYPSHELVLRYLKDYAQKFDLTQHIYFQQPIDRFEPAPQGGWVVSLADGRQKLYRGVVIANGHNWDPRWPEFPGHFAGEQLHSCQYKTPEVLQGKRVLIVGAGNSGCDIAVESSQHAAQTLHSMRRGYHYLPKFFHGTPIDQVGERLLRWRVPLWLRRQLASAMGWLVLGSPRAVGLPAPDHKLFETHPIINSQLYYAAAHGDLVVKPNVTRLDGNFVEFADGTREEVDVIVYATGFRITIPFVDREHLNWHDGRPDLYLNVMHPTRDDLFIAGLIQPDSGQWGLVDRQARLMAAYICGLNSGQAEAVALQKEKSQTLPDVSSGIRYVNSPRHLLEVEHFSYARLLDKQWQRLARRQPARAPAAASTR